MGYFISTHNDPNYRDESLIGSFDLSDIIEEGSVGQTNVPKIGKVQIYVYGGEGTIPHFHILTQNHEFETCLCIYEPKYFIHGSKTGRFNKKQLEQINNYLKSKHPVLDITIWQMIAVTFDNNNSTSFAYKGMKQPDYTKTIESIH